MTEHAKKLSRREALKTLGAATGASVLASLPSKWSTPEIVSGVLPAHAQATPMLPTVETLGIVGGENQATFNGNLVDEGSSSVIDRGFVWDTTNNPTLPSPNSVSLGPGGVGAFTSTPSISSDSYYGRAYATNLVGSAYGEVKPFTVVCLAEGTLIALVYGGIKKIEDIQYSDLLLVWNFDEGKFDKAQPLWIKKAEVTYRYNFLEFNDGSTLKTINQHRIFNKELGAFTYPMSEDTPVGTTTFNLKGKEVKLVSKFILSEQVSYYNVITHRHINLFADGILTSCRYNNIYPIVDMKFVKDERVLLPQEKYNVGDKYYEGLRLAEQKIPIASTIAYINRLKTLEVEAETVFMVA